MLLRLGLIGVLVGVLICFFAPPDHAGLNGGGSLGMPACGPHAAPSPATSIASLTCETFWDGPFSLGRIDTTDAGTCNGARNCWYTHNAFPNYPGGGSTITSPNCPGCIWNYGAMSATPSGDYSIDGSSQLVLAPASNTPYAGLPVMLSTCRYSASAPGYTGKTFHLPLYIEFVAPVASTDATGGEPNTILWFVPVEFLTAGVGATVAFPEVDIVEFPYGQGFIHDWGVAGPGTATKDNSNGGSGGAISGSSARRGVLLVDAAHNGGIIGIQKGYVNDVEDGAQAIQWQAGAGAIPAASPSNPNGTFTTMNTSNFCLQVGAGFNKNLTIQQIRIWQLSDASLGAANDNWQLAENYLNNAYAEAA